MEFKRPYMESMRQQAPSMFRQLVRSGEMEPHVQAKSEEAHLLLKELLTQQGADPDRPDPAILRETEERVRSMLIEFPQDEMSRPTAN